MKTKRDGFATILLLITFILAGVGVYYLSVNKRNLSKIDIQKSYKTTYPELVPEEIPEDDIDARCTFKIENKVGDFRVIRGLLTNAETQKQLSTYGYLDNKVEYLPDKSKALAYGSDEKITLLDFINCKASDFPPEFRFNTNHFMQTLRSISPSGEYVLYEIYHGYTSPPFPGSENDYSQDDLAENGIWLYKFKDQKNKLIRLLSVDTQTKDMTVAWKVDSLIIKGIGCPEVGCEIDLNQY